jgi:hypothetical protein
VNGQTRGEPAKLDSYQRDIASGLNRAFDSPETEEIELDPDSARLIIFSDHHKGSRDGADDFWRCERAYHAALGYYLDAGHRLFVVGDVEELWENSPSSVLDAYPATLALEGEFHRRGRYERFFGNHDDHWRHPDAVARRLHRFFPELEVREALKLRVRSGGQDLGLLFLVHGHQGTQSSDRFSWFSRLVVRFIWRPIQRRLNIPSTTPASDHALRARHDEAMYLWARHHVAGPVLIAGHTHHPVFEMSRPPPVVKRPVEEAEQELLQATGDPKRQAELRAELEFAEAAKRRPDRPPLKVEVPCYFNTGCCSFGDGDVTGIEIIDGEIRLVRWPDDDGKPLPKILVHDDLGDVLKAVREGRTIAEAQRP